MFNFQDKPGAEKTNSSAPVSANIDLKTILESFSNNHESKLENFTKEIKKSISQQLSMLKKQILNEIEDSYMPKSERQDCNCKKALEKMNIKIETFGKSVEGYEKDLFQLRAQFQSDLNQAKSSLLGFSKPDDLKHLEETFKSLNEIRFKAVENLMKNAESLFEIKLGDVRKENSLQVDLLQRNLKGFKEEIEKAISDYERINDNKLRTAFGDMYDKMNKVEDNFLEILKEKERVLEKLSQALGLQMERSFAMEQGSTGNSGQMLELKSDFDLRIKNILHMIANIQKDMKNISSTNEDLSSSMIGISTIQTMSDTVKMQNKKVELGLEIIKNYKEQFTTINERVERLEDIVLQSQEKIRHSLVMLEEGAKVKAAGYREGGNSGPKKFRNNFVDSNEDFLLESPPNDVLKNQSNNFQSSFFSNKKQQIYVSQSNEKLKTSKVVSKDKILFTDEEEEGKQVSSNSAAAMISDLASKREMGEPWNKELRPDKICYFDFLPSHSQPISGDLVKIDIEIEKQLASFGKNGKKLSTKISDASRQSSDERIPEEVLNTSIKSKSSRESYDPSKKEDSRKELTKYNADPAQKSKITEDTIQTSSKIKLEVNEEDEKPNPKQTSNEFVKAKEKNVLNNEKSIAQKASDESNKKQIDNKTKSSKIQFNAPEAQEKSATKTSFRHPEKKNPFDNSNTDPNRGAKFGKIESSEWLSPPSEKNNKKPTNDKPLQIEVLSDRTKKRDSDNNEESLDTGFFEITPEPTPEGKLQSHKEGAHEEGVGLREELERKETLDSFDIDDDAAFVGGIRGILQKRDDQKKPKSVSPKPFQKKIPELLIDNERGNNQTYSPPQYDLEESPKLRGSNLLRSSKLSSSVENSSQEGSLRNLSGARLPPLNPSKSQKEINKSKKEALEKEKQRQRELEESKKRVAEQVNEQQDEVEELVYQMDEQGFLMDEEGNYLMDENGNFLKLSPEQLEDLRAQNLIEEEEIDAY